MAFISQALNRLIQRHGLPLIYIKVDFTPNYPANGIRVPATRTEYAIRKAIHLTRKSYRDFFAKIAGNFPTTGGVEANKSRVLILPTDLPALPNTSDYIIINNMRYNIIAVEFIDNNQCYMLTVVSVTSEKLNRSQKIDNTQRLRLKQTVTYEL